MKPEINDQEDAVQHDEDVKFEQEKEPTPLSSTENDTKGVGETIIPAKEDTLGNSDFPPLTEADKEPKLPKEE